MIEFIRAFREMHWTYKFASVVFFLHACFYAQEKYQLMAMQLPPYSQLQRAEGRLVFQKVGNYSLTGIEDAGGNVQLFSCQLPGVHRSKYCFLSDERNKYGLNDKPHAVVLWYPVRVPFERHQYRYIFEIRLHDQGEPFTFNTGLGKTISFSYSWSMRRISEQQQDQSAYGLMLVSMASMVLVLVLGFWKRARG